MAVLKRIKFGSTSTPIAMTEVAINNNSSSVLSVVATNDAETDDANPLYTIALAVDGKTIAKGDNGLETSLALKVEAASGEGSSAKKARIALVDRNGGSGYAELSSVNIEDIVGNGVISSTSYDETTGILTITWAGGSTTEVNLGKLLDIDDIVVAQGSRDFLSFTLADPAAETGQAAIGVKLADVTYTPTAGSTDATLTVDTTNGKILDASDAIPAIQGYVDDVVANASTELAVQAQGDNYITAAVDAENNKKINVSADVQSLTATAGTPGEYAADGSQTTAPVAGTLSGTAESLGDAADIAAKVKTYVDGAIAIEAARSDAKNKADIAALDVAAVGGSDGDVLTQISETDGKISATKSSLTDVILTGYAADTTKTGAIAATDTLEQALNKIENTLAATTVKYNVVGTTLVVANVTLDENLTA